MTSGEKRERSKKRHKHKHSHRSHKNKKDRERKELSSLSVAATLDGPGLAVSQLPHEETEEEYDARLEREENERIALAKKHELEELKKRYEMSVKNSNGGIRYKGMIVYILHALAFRLIDVWTFISMLGRGKMKYIDPETRNRGDHHRP